MMDIIIFTVYLLLAVLPYIIIKKKPYLITKFYLFLFLLPLIYFISLLFYPSIEVILNILHDITQTIVRNPSYLIILLGSGVTLFVSVIKGGIWLKEKIKPLKIESILFEITSDKAMFERDIKGLEPYYDDRILTESAEKYLKDIPVEVRNNTNSTITINSIFLEVFRPISTLHKIKYRKIRYTLIIKDLDLPRSIKPKDSLIFKVSTENIIFIGETNKLLIKKTPYNYTYYPLMRFGILYDKKTYYSYKFKYIIVWDFFKIASRTYVLRNTEKIVMEMIKKGIPAPQLINDIEKLYLKRSPYPLVAYLNCYDDLLHILKNQFPYKTYIEEVNKRLSVLERKLQESFRL